MKSSLPAQSRHFELSNGKSLWGGWGSNPRPADYEKPGPVLRTHYLHGYHEALPPITLIAPIAQVTRSTNRSTPHHGDHRIPATERYRFPADQRVSASCGIRPAEEGQTSLTAEPLDLDYKHEIIRRVHQERNQASAVRTEMQ
jgi:hypothetical protein